MMKSTDLMTSVTDYNNCDEFILAKAPWILISINKYHGSQT